MTLLERMLYPVLRFYKGRLETQLPNDETDTENFELSLSRKLECAQGLLDQIKNGKASQ